MPEMTTHEISRALRDRNLSRVAEVTGLSWPTLAKLRDEPDGEYKTSTLRVVSRYLSGEMES